MVSLSNHSAIPFRYVPAVTGRQGHSDEIAALRSQ